MPVKKLILLSNWFIANMLSLSIDKTCYSVFGATDNDKTNIKLKIGDITLKQEQCSKYLGVIIIHAEHVVQSAWILFSLWMYVCMFVCMLVL